MNLLSDEFYMKQALEEAKQAFDKGEVPVGAIIVAKNKILAKTHNLTEMLNDTTAHAEMQAFTAASNYIGAKYLHECCLYVTLEPCVMCAGASYWTQIDRIVFGAYDLKRGFSKLSDKVIHPKTKVVGGILENECSTLLKNFFSQKR